jgi:hypothetical protein
MPVPLPSEDEVLKTRPSAAESQANAVGLFSAVAVDGQITPLQRLLIEALFPAMTEHEVDLDGIELLSAHEYACTLARRDIAFRTRSVQLMLLLALVLRPLPSEVTDRIAAFAAELGVDDSMIGVAQKFAAGSLGLAAFDFERNGYTSEWSDADADALHTSVELADAWRQVVVDNPAMAARWAELGDLPSGTLGRRVWELYRARGFAFPGSPGSAPPRLAQHDWVHVLADFGTTVASELEVFAFIARANDDMRAFALLAMVVSLFETGYLRTEAGLFQSDTGHLAAPGMAERLSDAMRRGAWCRDEVTGSSSIDYLRLDWFELAPLPVDEVRRRFGVRPKTKSCVAAGSVTPWEPGGISPFQVKAGQARAAAAGEPYDAYGAEPATK